MTPASPDERLRCLLVQPKFSANNFWNYVELAASIGAKTPAPPLGLLTVAALLPSQWVMSLVDLNVRDLTDADWDTADVVCVGGMLPQQPCTLDIINEARAREKYVVVGGPDPTSQPEVYSTANARVLGEGEVSIPIWLDSWRSGQPDGVFTSEKRPEITTSPIPRFELLNFNDYVHVGVQFSRGCPFNCEFCDIIELYGRVPRSKQPEQFLAELQRLYELGYRGWLDIVDDNFIGNKRQVKPMLAALESWSRERNYPFYFSTEATLNLADDDELLDQMQRVDFRFVFMGIETPDPELLAVTQKRVNAMRPIVERVQRVYERGISISAGFILGFDGERAGADQSLSTCIQDTGIVVAMVGLLVALPNTQLSRRLQRERRLIGTDLKVYTDTETPYRLNTSGNYGAYRDQAAGLNFVTTRDRVEIYREYQRVLQTIFSPRGFMDRVLATTQRLRPKRLHKATTWWEFRRDLRGFLWTAWWMTRHREVRWLYWRNTLRTFFMGDNKFDTAQTVMAPYAHFWKQAQLVIHELDGTIEYCMNEAEFPRQLAPQDTAPKNVELQDTTK